MESAQTFAIVSAWFVKRATIAVCISAFSVIGGMILLTNMISKFLRRDKDIAEEPEEVVVCYTDKYRVEYNKMCEETTELSSVDDSSLATDYTESDKTPAGLVHVRFDPVTKMFIWYSNTTSIPNEYLDTIARKMAIANTKPELYYPTSEKICEFTNSFNSEWEKISIPTNVENSPDANKPRDLFAKPKRAKMSIGNKKNVAFRKGIDLIKSKTNKYKRGGTLYDYEEYTTRMIELELNDLDDSCIDPSTDVSVSELQSMSYTDFKDKYISGKPVKRIRVNSDETNDHL